MRILPVGAKVYVPDADVIGTIAGHSVVRYPGGPETFVYIVHFSPGVSIVYSSSGEAVRAGTAVLMPGFVEAL